MGNEHFVVPQKRGNRDKNACNSRPRQYVNFCNALWIHTALPDCKTPDEVYFGTCNPRSKVYCNAKAFTPII